MVGLRHAVLALLLVGLAGCASPDEPAEPAAAATPSSGGIAGIVVDEAIRPLAAANVTLSGAAVEPRTTVADDAGEFRFEDLPYGTYILETRLVGFLAAVTTVHVAVAEPVPTTVRLAPDLQYQAPFYEQQAFEGYFTCVGSIANPCETVNVVTGSEVTDDQVQFELFVTPGAEFVQAEVVWEASGPGSENLSWWLDVGSTDEFEQASPECPSDFFTYTEVPSPAILTATAQDLGADFAAYDQPCDFLFGVQAGPFMGSPCVNWCLGLATQQHYKLVLTAFYGYAPPDGWRFVDGNGVPEPA